ncbi:IS630 family transposase [Rubritalea tangerina]|uniref:IS630 family transposase n=1 Tax=Rubritalea tangerina TaxID=430798 RepID=UPI00361D8530
MAGRPTPFIKLTQEERAELLAWTRRHKTSQSLVLRARIILLCDEGFNNTQIAKQVGVAIHTAGRWRRRFIEHRIEGLSDAPRCGTPRTISDQQVHELITKTLESTPKNATHWSTRKMAKECGVSHDTVQRIWKAFGLQPHRSESFQLSTDPFFVEKVRDVVGLYMSPPENAIVLSVDEKSQIQALERSQPVLPMRPGVVERQTHDYYRHGTTTLFAALDVATGKVLGKCYARHRQDEFVDFLKMVEKNTPTNKEIHIILDNYSTHKAPKVKRWLEKHPSWHLHFIPTHSSWLNQVERFFATITGDLIRRGVFTSVPQLKRAIMNYIEESNRASKPFKWTVSADQIFEKIESFCTGLR